MSSWRSSSGVSDETALVKLYPPKHHKEEWREEPSVYKIGPRCLECGRDYGVIERIPLEHVSHQDEVYGFGEESVRNLLG